MSIVTYFINNQQPMCLASCAWALIIELVSMNILSPGFLACSPCIIFCMFDCLILAHAQYSMGVAFL